LTRCRLPLLTLLAFVWLGRGDSLALSEQTRSAAVGVDEFVSELDRLVGVVGAAETPGDAAGIVGMVPEEWIVTAGSQTIEVSARWLTVALVVSPRKPQEWPAARRGIVRRLSEIRDQAASLSSTAAQGARADPRAMLASILDREEFRRSAASVWLEQFRQRLEGWFDAFMNRFVGGPAAGRRIAVGLAWAAAIAALAGLGIFLARSLAYRGTSLGLEGQGLLRPQARELALRAVAEMHAGNGREAVRLGYNAALARLEEQGVWRVDAARTPREYLPMLRGDDSRQPLMLDLTRRFERIWYGNRPVAAEDTPHVAAHLEELGCLRPGERAI
jgi:Domain of unknown function (DUF4129)